jgi:transketolase N-terminal domain/subunit
MEPIAVIRGSLGCADFLTALYFKIMKHNPAFNMDAMDEDVFSFPMGMFLHYFTLY